MTNRRHFGNVRKLPSGHWQASYWHEGQRHTAPVTFKTKADGLAYLASIETGIRRGGWIDPSAGQVKLSDYATKWLGHRPGLAERTVELYRYLLDSHIEPTFGATTLASITPSAVRNWHATLSTRHATTAAKAYRLLSQIMRTAVADEVIARSPCQVKGAAIEHAPERPTASVAEVAALAEAMPDHMRVAVLLAAWCQLRRGELLGLRRRDVDLLHGALSVTVTRTKLMSGEMIDKAPKSDAARRTVAVPSHVLPTLAYHLGRFVDAEPDALVLTGKQGAPLRPQVLATAWNTARAKIGRTDLRLHDLRHSGLTWAAATGATVAELQRRAGHASPTAALRYQHATRDRDKAIAEALGQLAEDADVVALRPDLEHSPLAPTGQ
jgi:integrase